MVDLPAGNHPFGPLTSLGASMVQASGEIAMLLANPKDHTIYYYKEGMAAPMGKFQTYSREPRALMVVDRSLRQAAPGVYATDVKLRRPGGYDVVFVLDVPRVVHCFALTVDPAPDSKPSGPRIVVEPASALDGTRPGQSVRLRFRLYDEDTLTPTVGIEDMEVQAFLVPGLWQKRLRLRETEPGLYSAGFSPPQPGTNTLIVKLLTELLLLDGI